MCRCLQPNRVHRMGFPCHRFCTPPSAWFCATSAASVALFGHTLGQTRSAHMGLSLYRGNTRCSEERRFALRAISVLVGPACVSSCVRPTRRTTPEESRPCRFRFATILHDRDLVAYEGIARRFDGYYGCRERRLREHRLSDFREHHSIVWFQLHFENRSRTTAPTERRLVAADFGS